MKKTGRVLLVMVCILLLVMGSALTAFAHSGRTDSSGGHKDNNNKSGLGSYHYHCGGYPAHLHEGGYCPYTDVFPSSVSMSVEKNTLRIGETVSVSAAVNPSNACNTSISWATSNPDVVTISDGKIKAVGYGTATISATSFNGKVGSVTITVKEITADSVAIQESPGKVRIGSKHQLTAQITPEDVENSTITWSSSDETVVSVNLKGTVEAVGYGTATITAATANGKTSSVLIIVEEVAAESVAIAGTADSLHLGGELQLSAQITPEDVDDATILWKTSDESVAIVDSEGLVKAVGIGTAVISAETVNGMLDEIELTITEIAAERVEIQVSKTVLHGSTVQAAASIYPGNTTDQEIFWEVSDPAIASIDENGNIQALNVGRVTITAIQKDVKASADIEVLPIHVEQIIIASSVEGGLEKGETAALTAQVFPENASFPQVSWKSGDPDVVSVDEYGNVEAKSLGTAVITAYTQDGCEGTYEISVLLPDAEVLGTLGGMAAVVAGGGFAAVRGVKKKIRARRGRN